MRPELIVKLRTGSTRLQSLRAPPQALLALDPVLLGLHNFLLTRGLTARPLRLSRVIPQVGLARPPFDIPPLPSRLESYWTIAASMNDALEPLRAALVMLPEIEAAFIVPAPEVMRLAPSPSGSDVPVATPDLRTRQGHLDPAPGGIDAGYAWAQAGGRGDGVSIIDIEGDWILDHESLLGKTSPALSLPADPGADWQGAHDDFLQHGTSVLGELTGNGVGVSGIAPAAAIGAISHAHADTPGQPLGAAAAIVRATDLLKAGDIMLLEMHMPGPRFGFAARFDQLGYIAVEWWEPILDAIKGATQKGVIVVEAGGNGRENLDDDIYERGANFSSDWRNPFRRVDDPPRDSGAIIVCAGAPPSGDFGRDRTRLDFSNFGSAVDAQAWGREVTTCGYGDLQKGDDPRRWYTATFAGTSSASPMIAGALACVQGVLRARSLPVLTPATARQLLRSTGSAQDPGTAGVGERIGNRPDLRAMIDSAIAQAQAVA